MPCRNRVAQHQCSPRYAPAISPSRHARSRADPVDITAIRRRSVTHMKPTQSPAQRPQLIRLHAPGAHCRLIRGLDSPRRTPHQWSTRAHQRPLTSRVKHRGHHREREATHDRPPTTNASRRTDSQRAGLRQMTQPPRPPPHPRGCSREPAARRPDLGSARCDPWPGTPRSIRCWAWIAKRLVTSRPAVRPHLLPAAFHVKPPNDARR